MKLNYHNNLRLLCIVCIVFLMRCGGSGSSEYTNPNSTGEKIKIYSLIKNMYNEILTKDSAKISACVDKSLYDDIGSIIEIMEERDSTWGKFYEFKIGNVTSDVKEGKKSDTVTYEVSIYAMYDYNESWDILTIQKIKKGKFKIVDYSFNESYMLNCAIDEVEKIKPTYEEYTRALVLDDTAKLNELCGDQDELYDGIIDLQADYFEDVQLDSVVYNIGYMNKACGAKGEANGIMIYTVYYNDSLYVDVIYKYRKNTGDDNYEVYFVTVAEGLTINDEEDTQLAEDISREIYKIIQKNDPDLFYKTFHTDLNSLYDKQSKKELGQLVEDFKAMGKLDSHHYILTLRDDADEFVYFIVILRMEDEYGIYNYLEMIFKPDANDKYMLMSCRELTH